MARVGLIGNRSNFVDLLDAVFQMVVGLGRGCKLRIAEGVVAGFCGCVARDSWIIPIHGWLRSLVDPVTRLVEENPRVG